MPRQPKPRWFAPRNCWRYRVDNVAYYAPRTIGPADEAGAWRWAQQVTGGDDVDASHDLTVAQLRNLYLQDLEDRARRGQVTPRYYDTVRSKLKTVRDFGDLGGRLCASLRVEHLEEFRLWLEGEGYRPTYVRDLVTAAIAMLTWATRPKAGRVPVRLLLRNPWAGVEVPRALAKRDYVDPADLRRFLRRCWGLVRRTQKRAGRRSGHDVLRAARLIRLTGARPGEIVNLKWSQVDPTLTMIELPPRGHKTGHATGKPRHIFLPAQCSRLMRSLAAGPRRADGFVFGGKKQGPWHYNWFSNCFGDWREKLGVAGEVRLIPYALRHAYCTDALSTGASYADVSKLVGNSPATLARHYDHPVLVRLAGVAAAIADRRQGEGRVPATRPPGVSSAAPTKTRGEEA